MTPRPEVTKYVVNQSSRNGISPRVITLHTTEGPDKAGITDLKGLGDYFNRVPTQASSHTANDAEGNDARFVADSRKAWACAAANPYTLNHEQIGYAAFTRDQWLKRMPQLRNTAEWIAYWSSLHSIPILHSATRGVCEHRDLGSAGGGHHDCGDGFPLELVLNMAMDTDPQVVKLKKWRAELDLRRHQLKTAEGGTRLFLIRRINELKRAISRTK
jgi:hypothetical protein